MAHDDMLHARIILVISMICFFSCQSYGQRNGPVKELNIENGLSQNSVTTITKDKYGFMWIGTMNGLNRYDGYDVTVYKNKFNDSSTITNNFISCRYSGLVALNKVTHELRSLGERSMPR